MITTSDLLKIIAKANRDAAKFLDCEHYNTYASKLEDRAAVYEAQEIKDGNN